MTGCAARRLHPPPRPMLQLEVLTHNFYNMNSLTLAQRNIAPNGFRSKLKREEELSKKRTNLIETLPPRHRMTGLKTCKELILRAKLPHFSWIWMRTKCGSS
jgi:hypothetical protein